MSWLCLPSNLPSGYHRDLQLIKEKLFPAITTLKNCLAMTQLMISAINVKKNILEDEKYKFLFSVEEVNKLVLAGVPFRDAYKISGSLLNKESSPIPQKLTTPTRAAWAIS
jgi:argininosuccinate lyase